MKRVPARAPLLGLIGVAAISTMVAVRAQAPQGTAAQRGQPAAPAGPLAVARYKNIQVLTDVPADMLVPTMQYFVQATGFQCQSCHVRDQATGEFAYEKDDSRTKQTARRMIKLVQTVNAGDFGARIQCGTCHAGHNQPQGLQMATPFSDEQIAAMAAQAARRGGGPGAGPGGGAPGGGRAQQGPPVAVVDDVIAKYVDGLGGRAALEAVHSREVTGTETTRARQSRAVTIDEKDGKYHEAIDSPGETTGFDGVSAWTRVGSHVDDLTGVSRWNVRRQAMLTFPLVMKDQYQWQGARPRALPGTQTPMNILQGTLVENGAPVPGVAELFYFDTGTGLLARRVLSVRTPMGTLQQQTDYADYRDVAGVKMPFTITWTDAQSLVTMTVSDIKANVTLSDSLFSKPGAGHP